MSQYDGPKGWWISENKKWIIRHCDRKWNIGDVEDIRMTQWCEVTRLINDFRTHFTQMFYLHILKVEYDLRIMKPEIGSPGRRQISRWTVRKVFNVQTLKVIQRKNGGVLEIFSDYSSPVPLMRHQLF